MLEHIQPNGDILLKKVTEIKHGDITKHDFKGSKIQQVFFNNEQLQIHSYKGVYETIYKHINDGVNIIKHSLLNIRTLQCNEHGFVWYPDIGISVQGVDSNRAILEIVNQCQKNRFKLSITILVNDRLMHIKV